MGFSADVLASASFAPSASAGAPVVVPASAWEEEEWLFPGCVASACADVVWVPVLVLVFVEEGSERCWIIVLLTANLYCGDEAEVVVEETRALRIEDWTGQGCVSVGFSGGWNEG